MRTAKHCLPPLAAVAAGLVAGAVGTVCLDGLAVARQPGLAGQRGTGSATRTPGPQTRASTGAIGRPERDRGCRTSPAFPQAARDSTP